MSDPENTRCIALTKSGSQCKNSSMAGSDFCYVHQKVADKTEVVDAVAPATEKTRCIATTQDGDRCQNTAVAGSDFCYVHQKVAEKVEVAEPETDPRLQELVAELDDLLDELKTTMPADKRSPYSPVHILLMLRENLKHYTPEVQLGILESFEGMSREDVLDIETWKGMAYMAGYSARFQAGVVREKMNETLPAPLKPDTVLNFMKQSFDRFAPDVAKEIAASFEDATAEDFMDPDTWKGVAYMVSYSLQFQAQQVKERITGETAAEE